MNSKEQKLMQEAMNLHYNCDEQHDCTHCLFGKGGIPCKVSGIPSEWFKDELMSEGVERLRDDTETICTATVTRTYKPVTRGEILDMAKKIVTGEREQQYGKPEDNFRLIGELWKIYLDNKYGTIIDIAAEDVALMMALVKNARIMTGIYKEDSYIDLCGYAACAGEIAAKNAENNETIHQN